MLQIHAYSEKVAANESFLIIQEQGNTVSHLPYQIYFLISKEVKSSEQANKVIQEVDLISNIRINALLTKEVSS